MPITQQQLLQILPNSKSVAGVFVPALNSAMNRFAIATPARISAFIAQCGHESAQLTQLIENLNYGAQALQSTWPTRFPAALAAQAARKPEQIANIAYASRMGNGPESSGDGFRYRGRGLFQVTGKSNYAACGEALGLDLINHPELLEQPEHAAMSAAWYWATHGLNTLADAGEFSKITQVINGGQNGADDRLALYNEAKTVLA